MARLTALDMVTFIRKGLSSVTTTEWSNVELLRFVNMATDEIAMEKKPDHLGTYFDISATAASGSTYSLPSYVMHLETAWNKTVGNRLRANNAIDYNRRAIGVGTRPEGIIIQWHEIELDSSGNKQIVFYLTPNTSQTIEFYGYKYPTEAVLTPSPTEIDLPREYDSAVIERARFIALSYDTGTRAKDVRLRAADSEGRIIEPRGAENDYPFETIVGGAARRRRRGV